LLLLYTSDQLLTILFVSGFTAITAGEPAEDGIYSYIPYAGASWDSRSTTETKKGVIIVNRKVSFNPWRGNPRLLAGDE
jgi:hypothetical protein